MKPTEPQPSGPFGPSDAPDARAARKNGFMRQPNTQAEAQHTQPSVGSIAAHRPNTVAATVSGLEPDIDADLDAYEESEESQDGGARLPQGRFLDRERSWLAFNERVLELAEDPSTPSSSVPTSSRSSPATWTSSSWSASPASSAASRPASPPAPPPASSPARCWR